jgi:hypothetical protein
LCRRLASSTLTANGIVEVHRSGQRDLLGPDQIRRFWETFAGGFEEIRLEIEDVVDLGDRIVAAVLSVMRGRGGVEVQARNAWLIEGRSSADQVSGQAGGPRSRGG